MPVDLREPRFARATLRSGRFGLDVGGDPRATATRSWSAAARGPYVASAVPVPSRNVRVGGSSTAIEVSGPPLRTPASASITAGDRASALALALRATRRRLHASRRRREAASPGGGSGPWTNGGVKATAGAPDPSPSQRMSVSSHSSPGRQPMVGTRSFTSRRVLRRGFVMPIARVACARLAFVSRSRVHRISRGALMQPACNRTRSSRNDTGRHEDRVRTSSDRTRRHASTQNDTKRHERAPTWSRTRICAERPKCRMVLRLVRSRSSKISATRILWTGLRVGLRACRQMRDAPVYGELAVASATSSRSTSLPTGSAITSRRAATVSGTHRLDATSELLDPTSQATALCPCEH